MTETPDIQICRAHTSESEIVWNIIDTCSKWLEESGLSHWINYYTKKLVDKKLITQEVYRQNQRPTCRHHYPRSKPGGLL